MCTIFLLFVLFFFLNFKNCPSSSCLFFDVSALQLTRLEIATRQKNSSDYGRVMNLRVCEDVLQGGLRPPGRV